MGEGDQPLVLPILRQNSGQEREGNEDKGRLKKIEEDKGHLRVKHMFELLKNDLHSKHTALNSIKLPLTPETIPPSLPKK